LKGNIFDKSFIHALIQIIDRGSEKGVFDSRKEGRRLQEIYEKLTSSVGLPI
jgi:hypothetical protein